ncbi:hypothetical protein AEA09_17155 [Lysinibacillus contaminans]|uniref:Uncharacterized protein n=1 Tax=Lysinibacillus contaminans TaxID=1293441 RepID=A0ABR5JWX4_9BACI|nr:hypothetical protein AEA09_17155 [Lysinibacillus contaminans]
MERRVTSVADSIRLSLHPARKACEPSDPAQNAAKLFFATKEEAVVARRTLKPHFLSKFYRVHFVLTQLNSNTDLNNLELIQTLDFDIQLIF